MVKKPLTMHNNVTFAKRVLLSIAIFSNGCVMLKAACEIKNVLENES